MFKDYSLTVGLGRWFSGESESHRRMKIRPWISNTYIKTRPGSTSLHPQCRTAETGRAWSACPDSLADPMSPVVRERSCLRKQVERRGDDSLKRLPCKLETTAQLPGFM